MRDSQWVKNPPPVQKTQETWVGSLGQEDSLEENGNTLQYSCLKNPMDRRAWWATVLGVAKSRTQLKCMGLGMVPFLPLTISFNFIIMFYNEILKTLI